MKPIMASFTKAHEKNGRSSFLGTASIFFSIQYPRDPKATLCPLFPLDHTLFTPCDPMVPCLSPFFFLSHCCFVFRLFFLFFLSGVVLTRASLPSLWNFCRSFMGSKHHHQKHHHQAVNNAISDHSSPLSLSLSPLFVRDQIKGRAGPDSNRLLCAFLTEAVMGWSLLVGKMSQDAFLCRFFKRSFVGHTRPSQVPQSTHQLVHRSTLETK